VSDRAVPTDAVHDWAMALRERFDLVSDDVPVARLLALTDDVTTAVAAPAAAVSAFVAGLVAGRAGGTPGDTREALEAIEALASRWAGHAGS